MQTLRVHSNRPFWLGRGAIALAVALLCASQLRADSGANAAMGLLGSLMFGTMALYALRQGLRRGPRLMLSEAGVDIGDLGLGVLPWSDIEDVEAFGSAQAPFLAFRVAQPGPYAQRLRWWPRTVVKLLATQGLPVFSVNLIGVDRDVGDVVRHAQAWLPGGR